MTELASQFVGTIPEHYDRGLGPNIFEDYADDVARRVAASAANSVLELAAGTGIVSRKLRDCLPPSSRLVVTDLNPPMLSVAQAKFADGEAEFSQADAMALPFEESEFDLIVCQFGVMFFPDKVLSFREALRVLRPGGRYIFSTWGPMAANPFSLIAHDVPAGIFPDDPPGFYRVPFSYHDPLQVKDDLEAAGMVSLEQDTISLRKTIADLPGFARGLVLGNPLVDEIRHRGGVDAGDVVAAIIDAFHERFGAEPMTMPLEATVFTARAA